MTVESIDDGQCLSPCSCCLKVDDRPANCKVSPAVHMDWMHPPSVQAEHWMNGRLHTLNVCSCIWWRSRSRLADNRVPHVSDIDTWAQTEIAGL